MNRTQRWKAKREAMHRPVNTKDECVSEIAWHLKKIKEVYYEVNPDADYLTLTIFKDSINFRNSIEDDKAYYINYTEYVNN